MKDEYIIINKTTIQKRIEELKKEEENEFFDEQKLNSLLGQIHAYKQILFQSIPLIPEVKKAFDAGVYWEENWRENNNKKDYISNLKLDI